MPIKGKKEGTLVSFLCPRSKHSIKFLESRVVAVEDVSAEKLCIMHAILFNFNCDWAKHTFYYLEYFVVKVGVVEG